MPLGVRVEPELYHGNLEAERDMTDVRDSAQVMVNLLERSAPGV
jgi:GDP-D-mannose dehydratase